MRQVKQIGIELEFSLMNRATCNPVVAGRYITATKEDPLVINGDMYHKDASMLEIAMQPATCPVHLRHIYAQAMAAVEDILPMDTVLLGNRPAVKYTKKELAADPYASVMGCSESMNVHGLPRISDDYGDNYRYGGMHVNIEVEDAEPLDALALDAYLGLISVRDWEQDHKADIVRRRQYYGKAGECRIKDFGIEYRTLPVSSFDPVYTEEVWELCRKALNCDVKSLFPMAETICHAIQTCDAGLAQQLIEEIHT